MAHGGVRAIAGLFIAVVEGFIFTVVFATIAYAVGDAYDLSGPVAQLLIPAALLAGFVVFVLLLRRSLQRRR